MHPQLARDLATGERFEAEWRATGKLGVVWYGARAATLTIVLGALAASATAAVALPTTVDKAGWPIAILVLVLGILALAAKAHHEWRALLP